MAGICLIRLQQIRPWFVPGCCGIGISSENAAHRMAVEWDESGASQDSWSGAVAQAKQRSTLLFAAERPGLPKDRNVPPDCSVRSEPCGL